MKIKYEDITDSLVKNKVTKLYGRDFFNNYIESKNRTTKALSAPHLSYEIFTDMRRVTTQLKEKIEGFQKLLGRIESFNEIWEEFEKSVKAGGEDSIDARKVLQEVPREFINTHEFYSLIHNQFLIESAMDVKSKVDRIRGFNDINTQTESPIIREIENETRRNLRLYERSLGYLPGDRVEVYVPTDEIDSQNRKLYFVGVVESMDSYRGTVKFTIKPEKSKKEQGYIKPEDMSLLMRVHPLHSELAEIGINSFDDVDWE